MSKPANASEPKSQIALEKSHHGVERSHHGMDKSHHDMDISHHGMDKSHHDMDKSHHGMNKSHHGMNKSHHGMDKSQHGMEKSLHGMDTAQHHSRSHHHHHMRPKSMSLPITNPDYDLVKTIYPFTMRDLNERAVNLGKYEGHVCILVNVASKSGFAEHNYKVLNSLYEKYADSLGLRILAFPCDQFNHTEFSSNREIKRFIDKKGVKFDVFGKISINCKNTHPLWKFMKTKVENTSNKWKLQLITDPFTKFIVSRTGVPFARLNPGCSEEEISQAMLPMFPKSELFPKEAVKVELPPPIEKKVLPCMRSWHFEPGILKLI